MVSARLEQEGVTLHYDRPPGPVWARGGEVRLGQVFLNLVTNAIDAMQNQSEKSLTVAIDQGPPLTVLIRDTGPGIDDPEKIDPSINVFLDRKLPTTLVNKELACWVRMPGNTPWKK